MAGSAAPTGDDASPKPATSRRHPSSVVTRLFKAKAGRAARARAPLPRRRLTRHGGPRARVTPVARPKAPEGTKLSKDAQLALTQAATVFISYIAATCAGARPAQGPCRR